MTSGTERREFVRYWLKRACQMREMTGAVEWSDMPLDDVEQVRIAYGVVKAHAVRLFSLREAPPGGEVGWIRKAMSDGLASGQPAGGDAEAPFPPGEA